MLTHILRNSENIFSLRKPNYIRKKKKKKTSLYASSSETSAKARVLDRDRKTGTIIDHTAQAKR